MSRASSFDGKEHSRDGKVVIIVITTVAVPLAIFVNLELGLGLLAGAFAGWWLTPDIDHRGKTHEEYRAEKKLGVLGLLWVAYWSFYAFFIPHRSSLSHGWLGTIGRFLYLMVPVWLVVWAVFFAVGEPFTFPWLFNGAMLGAWFIQDVFHYVRDGLL